ncbi:uncharacterized protein CLIB1423_04S06348 [[Candida] railenensis]|uniref:Enoyl reductase (ER) domain-containing protein n=1 Tax=[Candida] railenensis TaxID=45579 RepID=A0A9P0QNP1_9ASCO|nr:uncharacterized protein CLIB1423_04S06348 [[Candida] railenensis]
MSNSAAVSNGNGTVPYFEIEKISIPTVPKDRILVKTVAFAINPTDWKHLAYKLGPKGSIVGSDLSGIIEEVGSEVSGFSKGDIVGAWSHGGYEKGIGAFQQYAVVHPSQTIKFPKSEIDVEKIVAVGDAPSGPIDTFEGAASVPLGLSTVGMSFANQLKLKVENKSSYADKYILIWGGATATGILAIQVAKVVYGLKVIAAASKRNSDFLTSLGADFVVDYSDADAVAQIKKIGAGKIHYGLDTISYKTTFQALYDATSETDGPVVLDNLLGLNASSIETDESKTNVRFGSTLAYLVTGETVNIGKGPIPPPKDLVEDYNQYWFKILPSYLPKLKHSGLKVLKPGLESAAEGLVLSQENKVKAQKIVFRG